MSRTLFTPLSFFFAFVSPFFGSFFTVFTFFIFFIFVALFAFRREAASCEGTGVPAGKGRVLWINLWGAFERAQPARTEPPTLPNKTVLESRLHFDFFLTCASRNFHHSPNSKCFFWARSHAAESMGEANTATQAVQARVT
jgi:hypothetical protein